jgi:hypothetical protein
MKGMQKIKRGILFRGVLTYVFDRKNGHSDNPGQLIGGNMAGLDVDELVAEFRAVRKSRKDIKKPVWHNSLRLPKGDKLTKEQWAEIAEAYLNLLELDTSKFQYVCILHDDEEGQHIHIIANRIGIDGSVYLGRNENLISTRIISELEKEFGLTTTKGLNYVTDDAGKIKIASNNEIHTRMEVKSTKQELAMEKRKQESNVSHLNPKTRLARAINQALEGGANIQQFISRLDKMDIAVVANIAQNGTMNGFSFEIDNQTFKGSQVKASWSELTKSRGLDYNKERDTEILKLHHIGAPRPNIDGINFQIDKSQPINVTLASDSSPENIIKPEPTNGTKLIKIRQRILQSVRPLQESDCRAMVVYEAPEIRNGIDKSLCYNMPTNPMDKQACYSLRALLGNDADTEYIARSKIMNIIGRKYSWSAYYTELQDGFDCEDGANLSWWRAMAHIVFQKFNDKVSAFKEAVPDKYKAHVDAIINKLPGMLYKVPTDQPTHAVWKVEKPEPEKPIKPVEVNHPQPKQPSVEVSTPEIPARQQVDEPVHEEPDHYDYGWQEPKVADMPDRFIYPTPKNPWDSSGSDFSPW